MKRRALTRTERYASVILELKRGTGEPLIARERAKGMTAEEIIKEFESKIEADHVTPLAMGGSHHPSNIQPLSKEDHLVKTKRDVAVIAKSKRIEADQAEFRRRMLEKVGQEPEDQPQRRRKSRPMPGSKLSRWKKKIDGTVERR